MASGRTSGRGCCARVAELTGLSARSPRCWWTPTGARNPCPWGAVRRSGRRGGRSGRLWTGRSVVGGSRARVRAVASIATRLPGFGRRACLRACEVLAGGADRDQEPRHNRCVPRGLRRAQRTSRSGHHGLGSCSDSDMCVIHLLRNTFALPPASTGIRSSGISVRSVPRPPRQRPRKRFVEFTAIWGAQYPAITRLWENAWSEFAPFLDYGGCRRMSSG